MKIVIEIISSLFFIGYLPASGTFATIASFPLIIFLSEKPLYFKTIFILIFFILSVIITSLAEDLFLKKDDERIVIDEVLGFVISMFGIDIENVLFLFLGFIIFRVLDISKIFVKRLQRLPKGFGVVLDDFVCGLITNILLRILGYVINL